MRLLEQEDDGGFRLTGDIIRNVPPYAILSHTWGTDGEEVTFEDLVDNTGKDKAGYAKLRFCAKQAANDSIQYFWVDTCCINKSSSAELTEAINSMFRWYHEAVKCYVYLSDVSVDTNDQYDGLSRSTWKSAFRNSRWFTRGWTLQELISPISTEFFSVEGKRLGDKKSMEQQIHEITGVATRALQGFPLSEFTVDIRMSWAEKRTTTRKEDEAYCLLGIFNVHMPLIYGEGRDHAFMRLREEINKSQGASVRDQSQAAALKRLFHSNWTVFNSHVDEHERKCHPDTRTDLLRQVFEWVEHPDGKCILWLRGVAGAGKSAISRTVSEQLASREQLAASFFFKRGEGDRAKASRLFTTIAAQMIESTPALAPLLATALETDPALPEKALSEQFDKLIFKPLSGVPNESFKKSVLVIVIDALDECEREWDVKAILDILTQCRTIKSVSLRIFVTSRPELPIRLGFQRMAQDTHEDIALHDIAETNIKHDLHAFLSDELAQIRRDACITGDWPSSQDLHCLVDMAHPLFIYAATAIRFIGDRRLGDPTDLLKAVLEYEIASDPSKLERTYLPVLDRLLIDLHPRDQEKVLVRFEQIVGTIVILKDSLSIQSIARLLSISTRDVKSILDLLHSVLDVPADIDSPIRLHHLSFRDFLLDESQHGHCRFWINERVAHDMLATHCMRIMSIHLRENLCELKHRGILRSQIDTATIDSRLLPELKYACHYWVNHLHHRENANHDHNALYAFLEKHFLHWLEAMGVSGRSFETLAIVESAEMIVQSSGNGQLIEFLYDAKRFTQTNMRILDIAPLQIYSSSLIFAPRTSIVKNTFSAQIPAWIQRSPEMERYWDAHVQTLEGHQDQVYSVTFSPNGMQLASASDAIRLWDASSGSLLHTCEDPMVTSVMFSPNGNQLASASSGDAVRLWDVSTTTLRFCKVLVHFDEGWCSVSYSPNGKQLAAGHNDITELWDVVTGELLQTLPGSSNSEWNRSIMFSPDGKSLASKSADDTILLWDTVKREVLQKYQGYSFTFSPSGKQLGIGMRNGIVQLWDVATGQPLEKFESFHVDLAWRFEPTGANSINSAQVTDIAFSPDGKQLASSDHEKYIKIWDVATQQLLQVLKGHSWSIFSIMFSPDGRYLASASRDHTVRLWDMTIRQPSDRLDGYRDYLDTRNSTLNSNRRAPIKDRLLEQLPRIRDGHKNGVEWIALSPDRRQLASASLDDTIRLWDAVTGQPTHILAAHSDKITSVTFSSDSTLVASSSCDMTIRLWDAASGQVLQTYKGHNGRVYSVRFSRYSDHLLSASADDTVVLWDTLSGQSMGTKFRLQWPRTIWLAEFSPDDRLLALGGLDGSVHLCVLKTGELLHTCSGHSDTGLITSLIFSHDSKQLASTSCDGTLRLWDVVNGQPLRTIEFDRDASTGQPLQTIDHCTDVTVLGFSSNKAYLTTNRGILKLKEVPDDTSSTHGATGSIFVTDEWICKDGQRLMWLPHQYRGKYILVYDNHVVIGQASGRMDFWVFDF
ncbi:MAG: hypothetical protein M1822_003452 [Bathelium mastoideum]|nr:MAG: hypothetical protein M1822_003452 [Bathelium mastoideum]